MVHRGFFCFALSVARTGIVTLRPSCWPSAWRFLQERGATIHVGTCDLCMEVVTLIRVSVLGRRAANSLLPKVRKRMAAMLVYVSGRSLSIVGVLKWPLKNIVLIKKASPAGLASQRGPVTLGSNSSDPSEATVACSFSPPPAPKRRRSEHRTGTDYG